MKKIIFMGALCLLIAAPIFASDAVYERNRHREVVGWSVFGADDDVDATAELITELDSTYAQLAAEEAIEVLSADAADITQTVTVTGIDNAGKKVSEDFTLAGATVQTSTATFRYVDQVSVDIECAGAITVRKKTGDTFITSIPIGSLKATMVQHFNGEDVTYLTGWRASVTSTTGTMYLELRWYPDDADCLDAGDGYEVIDEIYFTNVLGTVNRPFDQPIKCPAGGWIAVYGTGGAADCDASVTLQGFDTTR